jgi:RNA polymerase sigma factor (sigma-70 family)
MRWSDEPTTLLSSRRLRRLDPRARTALHLRYFEDRSFAEVAETLGLKEPTARVIVHRALAKLRGTLGDSLAVGGVKA